MQVKPQDIKGDRRQQNIARARQVAMYLTRRITALSYPVIGEKFGGKDTPRSSTPSKDRRADEPGSRSLQDGAVPLPPGSAPKLWRHCAHRVDRIQPGRYTTRTQRSESVVRRPKINDLRIPADLLTNSQALRALRDPLFLIRKACQDGAPDRTDEFARALYRAQGIVEKKSTMPILASVLLEAPKTGACASRRSTWRSGSPGPIPARFAREAPSRLKHKELYDIVRALPERAVVLRRLPHDVELRRAGRQAGRGCSLRGAAPSVFSGSARTMSYSSLCLSATEPPVRTSQGWVPVNPDLQVERRDAQAPVFGGLEEDGSQDSASCSSSRRSLRPYSARRTRRSRSGAPSWHAFLIRKERIS